LIVVNLMAKSAFEGLGEIRGLIVCGVFHSFVTVGARAARAMP
jgi:hypothetical protein